MTDCLVKTSFIVGRGSACFWFFEGKVVEKSLLEESDAEEVGRRSEADDSS
jgi:hypothetical protein